MRFSAFSLGLLAIFTPLSAAWTKEGKFSTFHDTAGLESTHDPLFHREMY